jgi:hypothetical protein
VATSSRIDKGLLAIPVSLLDLFPGSSGSIYLLDESNQWVRKSFTAYDSTSRECQIGGMRNFYERHGVRAGDELVLQAYGDGRYKILPETLFKQSIRDLESALDGAVNQVDADAALTEIAALTHVTPADAVMSEYFRLAGHEILKRKVGTRKDVSTREHVPAPLRRMLTSLYRGRCQVSGFSFLKKDGEPCFEVHHIDPFLGNHPKNVLVVSPNVYAQFTHAAVEHTIDEFGWLRRVRFNGDSHPVFQVVDQLPAFFEKEVHSV